MFREEFFDGVLDGILVAVDRFGEPDGQLFERGKSRRDIVLSRLTCNQLIQLAPGKLGNILGKFVLK